MEENLRDVDGNLNENPKLLKELGKKAHNGLKE